MRGNLGNYSLKRFVGRLLGQHLITRIRRALGIGRDIENARSELFSQFVNEDALCFDIGANYGNRTAPLLSVGAAVVAVEPQIECCRFLERKFGSKIKIVRKGVGSTSGQMRLYTSESHTLATLSEDWIEAVRESQRFGDTKWDSTGTIVEVTTLDDLIEQFGMPHYIKIDVEGYEEKVLEGLSSAPFVLSFEYAVPEFSHKLRNCLEIIEALGGEYQYNYCVGERPYFELPDWLTGREVFSLVESSQFIRSGDGDMFARRMENDKV